MCQKKLLSLHKLTCSCPGPPHPNTCPKRQVCAFSVFNRIAGIFLLFSCDDGRYLLQEWMRAPRSSGATACLTLTWRWSRSWTSLWARSWSSPSWSWSRRASSPRCTTRRYVVLTLWLSAISCACYWLTSVCEFCCIALFCRASPVMPRVWHEQKALLQRKQVELDGILAQEAAAGAKEAEKR